MNDSTPQCVLDLACGPHKAAGAVGLDLAAVPGVDVVADIERGALPFRSDTFDIVHASHVIEHVESIPQLMQEIHRVARAGARVHIATPHYSWHASWVDPTHRWHLSVRTFSYFAEDHFSAYYTGARYRVVGVRLSMPRLWRRLGIEYLLNLENRHHAFRFARKFWEEYLAFVVRGKEMRAVLEVMKPNAGSAAHER